MSVAYQQCNFIDPHCSANNNTTQNGQYMVQVQHLQMDFSFHGQEQIKIKNFKNFEHFVNPSAGGVTQNFCHANVQGCYWPVPNPQFNLYCQSLSQPIAHQRFQNFPNANVVGFQQPWPAGHIPFPNQCPTGFEAYPMNPPQHNAAPENAKLYASGAAMHSSLMVACVPTAQSFPPVPIPPLIPVPGPGGLTNMAKPASSNRRRHKRLDDEEDYFCLMCGEFVHDIIFHWSHWHINKDQLRGTKGNNCYVESCVQKQTVIMYKYTSGKELRKCGTCRKVFFKHRCDNHICTIDQRKSTQLEYESSAEHADSSGSGKERGYCLMCKFYYVDLVEHKEKMHYGKKHYVIREALGQMALLPKETNDVFELDRCPICSTLMYKFQIHLYHDPRVCNWVKEVNKCGEKSDDHDLEIRFETIAD